MENDFCLRKRELSCFSSYGTLSTPCRKYHWTWARSAHLSVRIRDYLGHVPRRRAPDLHLTPMHNLPRSRCHRHPPPTEPRAGQKGARLQPLTSEFSGYFRSRRAPNDLRLPSGAWRGGSASEFRDDDDDDGGGLGNRDSCFTRAQTRRVHNRGRKRNRAGKIVFAEARRYWQVLRVPLPLRGYLVAA